MFYLLTAGICKDKSRLVKMLAYNFYVLMNDYFYELNVAFLDPLVASLNGRKEG